LLGALSAEGVVPGSGEEMAAGADVITGGAEGFEEVLRVRGRFEPLEHALSFSDRPVRVLGAIVESLVAPMLHAGEHPPECRWVTSATSEDVSPSRW
jgi:hypothetical protein